MSYNYQNPYGGPPPYGYTNAYPGQQQPPPHAPPPFYAHQQQRAPLPALSYYAYHGQQQIPPPAPLYYANQPQQQAYYPARPQYEKPVHQYGPQQPQSGYYPPAAQPTQTVSLPRPTMARPMDDAAHAKLLHDDFRAGMQHLREQRQRNELTRAAATETAEHTALLHEIQSSALRPAPPSRNEPAARPHRSTATPILPSAPRNLAYAHGFIESPTQSEDESADAPGHTSDTDEGPVRNDTLRNTLEPDDDLGLANLGLYDSIHAHHGRSSRGRGRRRKNNGRKGNF